jgi:hypothetical protein
MNSDEKDYIENYPRKIGTTTRLANELIERLFQEGKITCIESPDGTLAKYDKDLKRSMSRHLYNIVRTRLIQEHNGANTCIFDNNEFTVTLKELPKKHA